MEEVHSLSRISSYTTHPGIIAAEAASLLGHLIVAALRLRGPVDPKAFLEEQTASYMKLSGLCDRPAQWGYTEMKWLVTGNPVRDEERCWKWREESLDIRGTLRAR